MKKILLLVLIAILGIFIYLKTQALGDPNSSFNRTTRLSLGRYQIMRSILGLHSYGDARYDYLVGASPIAVEVVKAQNTSLDETVLTDFTEDVKTYTGRPAALFDTETVQAGVLSDADLATIAIGSRHHLVPGEPNLFVVYAEDFQRTGEEVGKTFGEFGIVVSEKRLKEVTASYPGAFKQYVESTLLHEFGHQVGLEHNDQPGCIMNAQVEHPSAQGDFSGQYTDVKFCDYELNQLNSLKANIK